MSEIRKDFEHWLDGQDCDNEAVLCNKHVRDVWFKFYKLEKGEVKRVTRPVKRSEK